MTDTDPLVLINAFEVPADADDDFVAGWEAARDYLRYRPHPVLYELIRT